MADNTQVQAPKADVKIEHSISNTTLLLLILGGWLVLRKMK